MMDARHDFTSAGETQPATTGPWYANMFCYLGGSHAEEAACWSPSFRVGVMTDGGLVLASQIFVAAGVVTGLTQIDVAAPLAAAAGLVASTVTGLGERAILDFDLSASGAQRLTGLGIHQEGSRWSRWIVGGARIGLAALTANFTATLLSLGIFAQDIDNYLTREWQAANRRVNAAAALSVDRRIATQHAAVVEATRELDQRRAAVTKSIATPGDPSVERAIELARSEEEGLSRRLQEIDRLSEDARVGKAAERAGVKAQPGNTGDPGEGREFRFHKERLVDLSSERAVATAELAVARQRTAAMMARRDRGERDDDARNRELRPDRDRALATATSDLAAAKAAEAGSVRNRKALVEAEARADPRWTPRDNGLIARIRALEALSGAGAAVRGLVLSLALFLLAIELSPVLRRLLAKVDPLGGTLRLLDHRGVELTALAAFLERHGPDQTRENTARDDAFERARQEDRRRAQRRRERRFRDFIDRPLGDLGNTHHQPRA